ncbi:MAG: hypothetical protein C3F12_05400 [Candidatus Methylomirabilota bacterium]|nr:MAG: hypothetical protein C3F12_05400 [candidate division NC10 bacterium]
MSDVPFQIVQVLLPHQMHLSWPLHGAEVEPQDIHLFSPHTDVFHDEDEATWCRNDVTKLTPRLPFRRLSRPKDDTLPETRPSSALGWNQQELPGGQSIRREPHAHVLPRELSRQRLKHPLLLDVRVLLFDIVARNQDHLIVARIRIREIAIQIDKLPRRDQFGMNPNNQTSALHRAFGRWTR